jgi:hypothetical protein
MEGVDYIAPLTKNGGAKLFYRFISKKNSLTRASSRVPVVLQLNITLKIPCEICRSKNGH